MSTSSFLTSTEILRNAIDRSEQNAAARSRLLTRRVPPKRRVVQMNIIYLVHN